MDDWSDCCSSGDIVVTPVPSGFMVGRVLPKIGVGPWWEFVAAYRTLRVAVKDARTLAGSSSTSAWFQTGLNSYRHIPLDDSEYLIAEIA